MSGRLPFNAAGLRSDGNGPKPKTGGDNPLTVTALAGKIDSALKQGLPGTVKVVGEVSGFRDRTHWYFDLKDETAVVSCAMFASSARRAPVAPEDGMRVVVSGRVDWYAKGGRLSLIVTRLEPVGAGALDQELKRRVEEARSRGWLDPESKRPLPRFPRRIAILTSRTSAGLQDILDTLRKRAPFVEVALVDVRVQGDPAAAEIADALETVGTRAASLGIDAVLITRGGGSTEDLWCFNDWHLAETIARCPVPVAAAIGHETDTTLAELVADERCATPTQAAVRLSPDREALYDQLAATSRRLDAALSGTTRDAAHRLASARSAATSALSNLISRSSRRLDRAAIRLERARPERRAAEHHAARVRRWESAAERLPRILRTRLETEQRRLADVRHRLPRAVRVAAESSAEALDGLDRELHAVNPLEVLRRGYSVTMNAQGKALRSPSEAGPGEQITTRLADGELTSRIVSSDEPDAPPAAKSSAPAKPAASPSYTPSTRRKRRRRGESKDQMDLFGAG